MNFKPIPNISNNIYSYTLTFDSWGGNDISGDAEKAMFSMFPCYLDYTLLTFSGKYKYDTVSGKVIADSVNGDSVSIVPASQHMLLDENFSVTFQYSVDMVMATEVTTNLPSRERVAESKVILFANTINTALSNLITATKAKRDNYLQNNASIETL